MMKSILIIFAAIAIVNGTSCPTNCWDTLTAC